MIRELWKPCSKHLNNIHSVKGKVWRVVMPGSNIRKLEPENTNQWSIMVDMTVNALLKGQVVAIPTDTLYGLVTLAEHSNKLYRIKRRFAKKPLGVFFARTDAIKKYCVQTVPDEFLKIIYPGPVTLLFERTAGIPSDFNPGCDTVGVRVPQAKFARDLAYRLPFRLLAQTSANVSGRRNLLCIQGFEEIWDDIDLIVDAGPIIENDGSDEGSTVIDLSVPGQFKMIRQGCAPIESVQLLREFGIRSVEEVERERLTEAGKGLTMLDIVAHEKRGAEESVENEEETKSDNRDGVRGETVAAEEKQTERDTGRQQQKADCG